MPAAPATPQTVTVNGQSYNVPGGGRGSTHSRGEAVDIPEASSIQQVLAKHGLNTPLGAADPVHVQKVGSAVDSGGGGNTGTPGQGTGVPGRGDAAGVGNLGDTYKQTNSILRGGVSPTDSPNGNGPQGGPPNYGRIASTTAGLMPRQTIQPISAALGGNRYGGVFNAVSQLGNVVGSIVGSSNRASQERVQYRDAPNPNFPQDNHSRNNIPSGMPHRSLLENLFDLRIAPYANPGGYVFGR